LTVVEPGDEKAFLAPLPVQKLLWVGKKTARKLRKMGVETIGDLAKIDASVLKHRFGTMGTYYGLAARGIDDSEVVERSEVKSVGREVTFEEDTFDRQKILVAIDALSQTLHEEIADRNLMFKTVTIKIRFRNFETHTRARTLPFLTNNVEQLTKSARELIKPFLQQERMIRLVGVRVSNLFAADVLRQRPLFDHALS
jgi:DNA polymerase IV (DinB-like DNA polymerase)